MSKAKQNDASIGLLRILETQPVPSPKAQWPVCDFRKWRFDIAWPDRKIAVEVNGLFSSGGASRHCRPMGHARDCEKLTVAAALGWRVLVFTTEDLRNRPATIVRLIVAVVNGQRIDEELSPYRKTRRRK